MFEASVFRGEEPDENRLNIERPRLDSWAVRVGWRRGPWQAQISGGRLHEPEWFEPYDVTRLTASIGFDGAVASRALAATLAWGQNREITLGNTRRLPARMGSVGRTARRRSTAAPRKCGKADLRRSACIRAGFARPSARLSDIDALTVGSVRDLPIAGIGRVGIGGDITVYRTSARPARPTSGRRVVPRVPALAARSQSRPRPLSRIIAGDRRLAAPWLSVGCRSLDRAAATIAAHVSSSPSRNCSAPPCAMPAARCGDACARSRSRRRIIPPASRT